MTATAYPLQWPAGWTRTPSWTREDSRYSISEGRARSELIHSIEMLGGDSVVLSTNIKLRQDGLPYANRLLPDDPGIAVYWTRKGRQEVMACDLWLRPWENMRAVGLAIEGLRAMQRSGATQILERAFSSFALPAGIPPRPWRSVFGFGPDEQADPGGLRSALSGLPPATSP